MRRWALLAVVLCGCDQDPAEGPPGDAELPGDGARTDGPAPDAPGGVGEPAELAGITRLHNEVRAAVDTQTPLPALTWSPALAATAMAWAMQCRDVEAPTGLIDHNAGRSQGHPYYVGENIYGASGNATAQGAVSSWAAEKANYDYASNTCPGGNRVCGHYTQVVWRDTREVGCALYRCPGLQYGSSIVCDYGPGGNVNGARPY
ncbi:MAG: CAP domain-containing protein [Kofleriaceae bacterium]